MKTFEDFFIESFKPNPKIGKDGEMVLSLSGSESKAMPIFNDISKNLRQVKLEKTSNILEQRMSVITKFKDKDMYRKFNELATNLEEDIAKVLAKKLTNIENEFIKNVITQIELADDMLANKLDKIDITKL